MIESGTLERRERLLVLKQQSPVSSRGSDVMLQVRTALSQGDQPNEILHHFFQDCGGDPSYQLAVTNGETKEVEIFPIDRPFLLLGRSADCSLVMKHWDISYRHCYLQLLGGRILCVDLDSRSGTLWNNERRRSGWLVPGKEVLLGRHSIRLVKGMKGAATSGDDSEISVTELLRSSQEPFPKASLELLSQNSHSRTGKFLILKPGVTLVGRSRVAQVRLKHDSVSLVHSSLVLTQNGLWAVDLLGRGGTLVNGESVEYARLQKGDVVTIGAFHMLVDYGVMNLVSPTMRKKLRDHALSNEDSSFFSLSGGDTSVLNDDTRTPIRPDVEIPRPPEEEFPENGDNSASRWSDLIEALKSGGFGE